ncbi:carbohydrate sulfotransferase 3-like [Mytilus californianus]|uniref:carbohydrate sulfotransferase 3-like n=1 Tax=Mytilus californianus TaxID=6549 RepID=UPI0022471E9B|nr:carbohydrate sulfotransferase 3-like [Mytilus californianus]
MKKILYKVSNIKKCMFLTIVIFVFGNLYMLLTHNKSRGFIVPRKQNAGTVIKARNQIVTEMTSPFLLVKNDKEWIEEKPEPDNFCNNVTCVLIVGYVRGGTTMILDTLAETNSNFYLFEPIRNLTESSYANMPITFYNGTVRNISMDRNLARVQTEMLNHWFNCYFTKINIGDLKNNHLIHSRATKSYFACLRKSPFPFCIKMLESVCVPKTRRIMKVVRLRMKSVEHILKKTDNLKIIYVVRDPRAQIHSLIKSGLLDQKSVKVHSRELCEDMMSDFNSTKILKRAYHNNIFMLKYEALVTNPLQNFRKLFSFSNLPFTTRVDSYIRHHMLESGTGHEINFNAKSGNSTLIAIKWRTAINKKHLRIIDEACHRTYETFGYHQLDIKSLQTLSIDIQGQPSETDIFDLY